MVDSSLTRKGTKILYIITKLELGGAQKQLLEMLHRLDYSEFIPYLFTGNTGMLVEEASSLSGVNLRLSKFLVRQISPIKDILALFEIYSFIKKNNINIVHTHSSKAGAIGRIAAKLAGVEIVIHTVHGWSFNKYQFFLIRKLYIYLERLCAGFCSRIIVVSEHDKNTGIRNKIGTKDKFILLSYGIDRMIFKNNDSSLLRKEFRLSNEEKVVAMVACFKPQKRPEDFIRVAALTAKEFPCVRFLMFGDGILRPEVERLIKVFSMEGKIIIAGWRKDIPNILAGVDVLMLTSLWEGLPICVLEAMASACPVVATDTGGISEVVEDGKTGYLVGIGDIQSLANKLRIILRNPQLRNILGANAREALGVRFDIREMVKRHQGLYAELIRRRYDANA